MGKGLFIPQWVVNSIIGASVVVVVLGGLLFLVLSNMVSYREVYRVTSPDGVIDAVWVETDAGATTGYAYRLYIVPRAVQPSKRMKAIFVGDLMDGVVIRWVHSGLLEISYSKAAISYFSNVWVNPPRAVEVQLKLTSDSAISHDRLDAWNQALKRHK